ncbi:MAG: hypothetical protein ACR2NZ_19735 [Rubripirellula sp.]
MDRFAIGFTCFGILSLIGCGSSTPVAENAPPVADQVVETATAVVPSPTDVVSQFLDEIRRGGADSSANTLLTSKAQAELKRIGQSIQPIGSPDAGFQVTRSELVPGDERAALVHSVWTEPAADGNSTQLQVVWAVQRETAGWRISGLAMELDPDAEPVIFDFENGERMAELLANPDQTPAGPSGAASQATGPAGSVAR